VAKIYKLKQEPKQKHDRLDEWRKMMYNVFKDIPEVAWQIMTYLKPNHSNFR
jgi:L-threonylcarbamoyladenylate synthase